MERLKHDIETIIVMSVLAFLCGCVCGATVMFNCHIRQQQELLHQALHKYDKAD
jgi:hypothetical protein